MFALLPEPLPPGTVVAWVGREFKSIHLVLPQLWRITTDILNRMRLHGKSVALLSYSF
jgi:hypothetical protein